MKTSVGIYNLRIPSCGGGGGEKRTLVMAEHLSRRFNVTLLTGQEFDAERQERYFSVDLSRVNVVRLPGLLPFRSANAWADTLERVSEVRHFSRIQALGLDVFINNHWASNLACPAKHGIYMCMFPHELQGDRARPRGLAARLRNRLLGMPGNSRDSYEVITANSGFTASWVRRFWGREANIVYSVGEPMGPAAEKRRWILHVGRFVDPSRADNKHQRTLLDAFCDLRDLHAEGWELHFAGTVMPDAQAQRAARELEGMAASWPVCFHFNAAFDELRELYRQAAIYWHATGYGSQPQEDPHKQEHFGITTVEAMSAGAVPLVINRGGQPEIVDHLQSGFVWDSLSELASYTRRVARDADLRQQLSQAAGAAATRFSRSAFQGRIERIVDGCLEKVASGEGLSPGGRMKG
jgi:glycosyltransferase involved in cell wall biosynthesis